MEVEGAQVGLELGAEGALALELAFGGTQLLHEGFLEEVFAGGEPEGRGGKGGGG